MSLDDTVELAVLALAAKSRRLSQPETGLGPASGLPPYPGEPGEIMPPAGDAATAVREKAGAGS